MNIVDSFSPISVPIFMNDDSRNISHGSCLFYVKHDTIFVVTKFTSDNSSNPF
jgi:hypothetical protein